MRLVGATVAGLALLSGSVGSAGVPGAGGAASLGDAAGSVASIASVAPLAASATGLELNLTRVTPAAAGPDDEVVVSGTIHNRGNTVIKNARISLWLNSDVLADRAAINTWLDDDTLPPGNRQLAKAARVASLASGATAPFRIVVPPGETGLLRGSSFGPRGIVLQAKASGRRLTALRSTIVWAPSDITTPTRLSVIVPITSTAPTTHAGEPTAVFAASLRADGRLQRVLSAAHTEAMAWAIDPAILLAAKRLSTDGIDRSPDDADLANPGSADPNESEAPAASATSKTTSVDDAAAMSAARDWLSLFNAERRDRGLFGLPYADPDLTSVLRTPKGATAKGVSLLRNSDDLGKAAALEAIGGPIDTTLAWPADGQINAATIRSLVRLKRTRVILASTTQRTEPSVDYTPTGRSTVSSSAGSLTGLLYDEQLSALLGSPAGRTPAATQTLLAQLAAITMEQPGTGRHLLAVTPRTWDPDPTAVQHMMNALGSAPWISLRGISELQKAEGPPRSAPVYRRAAAKAELPPGVVSNAQVLDKGLAAFAPILLNDPAPVEPLRERVASLLSVAWRQDPDKLVPARRDVAADVNALVNGVQLTIGDSPRFTARTTPFPVTVVNDTKYDIEVVVQLKQQSPPLVFGKNQTVLVFGKNQTVKVKAEQSAPVLVKATAVTDGDVVVEGRLLNGSGDTVGPGVDFAVQVRPKWERWGMIGVGSVLGFLLVIGLLRGLRRNRTRARVPIEAVPDVDELAIRRATEAEDAEAEVDEAEVDEAEVDEAATARVGAGAWPSGSANPWPIPDAGPRAIPDAAPRAIRDTDPLGIPNLDPRAIPSADPAAFRDPNPGTDPFPDPGTGTGADPFSDPASGSKPEPEPDPKVWGGPVDSDGVRPRAGTRPGP